MERVHRELGDKDRSASFVAVLALAFARALALFRGEVTGSLVWPPRGDRGFGYDPMFVPEGGTSDLWRNGPGGKAQISHRARAFAKLVAASFASRRHRG